MTSEEVKKVERSAIERFADVCSRIIPDALTAALLMFLALFIWCLIIGTPILGKTVYDGKEFSSFLDSFFRGFWSSAFMVFTL